MNKKIAVLVKRFPKLSETFILGEISSLLDQGLDLEIISIFRPNEAKRHPAAEKLEGRVTYLDNRPMPSAVATLFKYLIRIPQRAPALIKAVTDSGIDVTELAALLNRCDRCRIGHLHAHYISEPALLAELAAKILNISYSVSAHAKDIYLTRPADIRERLTSAAFVTTCTAHNADYLRRLGEQFGDKIHLVYHGIDSEQFCPAPQHINRDPFQFTAIGRYKEKKGFDLLVEACAMLIEQGHRFHCEIIGYGDQRPYLEQLIADYNVGSRVSLKAPVAHDELPNLLRQASAFVLPCRLMDNGDRDGIPNSMLEAMACGVPVISTNVSGIPEVVSSFHNGLLVEPDNTHALAGAMSLFLSDQGMRDTFGKRGRTTIVERFNWQKNTKTLTGLLQGVVHTQDSQMVARHG